MHERVSTRTEPVVLLAFANTNEAVPLRNLEREERAIRAALEPLVVRRELFEPKTLWNATPDAIMDELRKERFHGRFRVFHFGGHANGSALMLANDQGSATIGHAAGLADFLGRQQGLELVVLNGCSTLAQVERLRKAGVKAVIATSRAIMDDVAAELATQLYKGLVTRPLKVAFEEASAAVRTKRGESPRELVQEDLWDEEEWDEALPWVLSCDAGLDAWMLVPRPKYDLRVVVGLLSSLFSDSDDANLVARRAGFPVGRLPRFTSAIKFWSAVVDDASKGNLAGGIDALLDEAASMYPHNRELVELRK